MTISTQASQFERLTFFSGAVFAISITLLAIEIGVPRLGVAGDHASLEALVELGPSFIGFVLSLLVIGALSATHHRVFGMLGGHDRQLLMPLMVRLMLVAFTPFATATASASALARVPKLLFSSTLQVAALLQCWLFGKALREPCLRAQLAPAHVAAAWSCRWALPSAAALSLVLDWFVQALNNLVLLIIPILTHLFPRISIARVARSDTAASAT